VVSVVAGVEVVPVPVVVVPPGQHPSPAKWEVKLPT
jgi:hypothetical protein